MSAYKRKNFDHLRRGRDDVDSHSYFSWSQENITTPATVTNAETSILSRGAWGSPYLPSIIKTSDITIPGGVDVSVAGFDAVTFSTPGKYLIFFSGQFDATNLGGAGATTGASRGNGDAAAHVPTHRTCRST